MKGKTWKIAEATAVNRAGNKIRGFVYVVDGKPRNFFYATEAEARDNLGLAIALDNLKSEKLSDAEYTKKFAETCKKWHDLKDRSEEERKYYTDLRAEGV